MLRLAARGRTGYNFIQQSQARTRSGRFRPPDRRVRRRAFGPEIPGLNGLL